MKHTATIFLITDARMVATQTVSVKAAGDARLGPYENTRPGRVETRTMRLRGVAIAKLEQGAQSFMTLLPEPGRAASVVLSFGGPHTVAQ